MSKNVVSKFYLLPLTFDLVSPQLLRMHKFSWSDTYPPSVKSVRPHFRSSRPFAYTQTLTHTQLHLSGDEVDMSSLFTLHVRRWDNKTTWHIRTHKTILHSAFWLLRVRFKDPNEGQRSHLPKVCEKVFYNLLFNHKSDQVQTWWAGVRVIIKTCACVIYDAICLCQWLWVSGWIS